MTIRTRFLNPLLVGLSLLAPGCSETNAEIVTTESGLKFADLRKGTGEEAKKGDVVVLHYTGRLKNGEKFDSSRDRNTPYSFKLGAGKVIKGWDEGVIGMKVGGKRKLIIPPDLAYGKEGRGTIIPPDSELRFEVELLQVKR